MPYKSLKGKYKSKINGDEILIERDYKAKDTVNYFIVSGHPGGGTITKAQLIKDFERMN
jgi:hypothetical protein